MRQSAALCGNFSPDKFFLKVCADDNSDVTQPIKFPSDGKQNIKVEKRKKANQHFSLLPKCTRLGGSVVSVSDS